MPVPVITSTPKSKAKIDRRRNVSTTTTGASSPEALFSATDSCGPAFELSVGSPTPELVPIPEFLSPHSSVSSGSQTESESSASLSDSHFHPTARVSPGGDDIVIPLLSSMSSLYLRSRPPTPLPGSAGSPDLEVSLMRVTYVYRYTLCLASRADIRVALHGQANVMRRAKR